jgi:alkylation response protein AidB-like acyl-CoA dehydrogenase
VDFNPTPEQKAICRTIREMCTDAFNGSAMDDDRQGAFSRARWDLCGDVGVHGLVIPQEYGGSGHGMLTTALAIETLGLCCSDEGLVFSLCANLCTCTVPLCRFGTDTQKKSWLPGLATGRLIGGNGMTEESAGSDSGSIQIGRAHV